MTKRKRNWHAGLTKEQAAQERLRQTERIRAFEEERANPRADQGLARHLLVRLGIGGDVFAVLAWR
jgi:hypothetical protein